MNSLKKQIKILVPILVLSFVFSVSGDFLPSSFGESAKVARRRRGRFAQETKKDAQAIRQQRIQITSKIEPGILVTAIVPDSAASYAGLKAGDVITRTSISNDQLTDVNEFIALLKNAKEGKILLMITRDGQKKRIIAQLPPLGISPRLGAQISTFRPKKEDTTRSVNVALKEATRRLDYKPSGSLNQRLDEINVLKYAMIDEDTGRVIFIGTYDPTYASGTIPYSDLLADALTDPYPSFSLDYKPAMPAVQKIKQIIDAEMYRISTNTNYGIKWMTKTLMSVINSKEPIPEKLIFEQRMRQKMGIQPEEFQAYLNWDAKSNQTTYMQYELIGNFMGKLFTSLGIEERFGKALVVFSKAQKEILYNTPKYETTLELCDLLHINKELQQIRSDFNENRINDETAGRRIYSLIYRTLLKGLGVPSSEVDRMADRYRNGYTWDEDLAYAVEEQQQLLTKEALRLYVFQSFVLSQDFLQTMYPTLPLAYSGVLLYGRSADSPLARVMFDADYALKYINSLNPDTLAIPGHQSSLEFLTAEEERLGIPLPEEGWLRFWIKPGTVKMDSFQDKSGVYFVYAEPDIGVEPLFPGNGLGGFEQSLDTFALELTKRYDAYAKLYPSLHVMRETEKIIAFARWLKNNNITVNIPAFEPVKNPVPEKVKGFVSVAYVSKATGDMDSMFLDVDGGVDFGQEEGEYWIHEEPSVEVTDNVLNQLQASTALAEQAAGAALDGELETARDLAEKSAQAMTGVIDTTQLPIIVDLPVPVPSAAPDTASVGTRSVISKEAITAVDRNIQATAIARKQITNAESFRETKPEQYEAAMASARKLAQRSQDNLRYLQERLARYRSNPVYPQKLIMDLQNLDPAETPVVKPLRSKQQVLPQKAPSIEKAIPEKEKLLYELSALESDLAMTRATLMRLTRNVQANNMLFKEWQSEAAGAIDRAEDRAMDLIQDTCSDGFFSLLKWKFKKMPDKIKQIDNFETTIAMRNVLEWKQIGRYSWEEIGKTFISAVQASPISAEAQVVINSTQSILDSSYDITAWFVSWRQIQQLDKNSDAYLIAVEKISKHMEKIVTRIASVKTQLKVNKDQNNAG
jgi:hypothetical protein